MYGFYRFASVSPVIRVADIEYNVSEIIRCGHQAEAEGASLILFPELSITGATCGDLFLQPFFIRKAWDGLCKIAEEFSSGNTILIVGLPVLYNNNVYNCAAVIQNNKITLSPGCKTDRYFSDGTQLLADRVPEFTDRYRINDIFSLGIEVGDDWKSICSPAMTMMQQGVSVICNPAKGNITAADAALKRETFKTKMSILGTELVNEAAVYGIRTLLT